MVMTTTMNLMNKDGFSPQGPGVAARDVVSEAGRVPGWDGLLECESEPGIDDTRGVPLFATDEVPPSGPLDEIPGRAPRPPPLPETPAFAVRTTLWAAKGYISVSMVTNLFHAICA